MSMTGAQCAITILVIMGGTMLTRFLPFILFRPGKPVPPIVRYLGRVLPFAAIGLLVVYCLRDTQPLGYARVMPKVIAVLTVFAAHRMAKNTLLSILAGTLVYMVCVQFLF